MDNGWLNTTLGELCDRGQAIIQTGPFGSQLHSYDHQTVGVPVVPTEAIGRRRIRDDAIPRVSEAVVNRLARHKLRAGDILFARRGAQATGLSALVESKHEGWLCGTGAILMRLETAAVDPTFLSFLLSSDIVVSWLKTHAVGAVMPNLNEGILRRLPLLLPSLKEQRTIAQVLGTLDDKIELNRRMNETLEAMTQALFKTWFMNASVNGLPEGWRASNIGEEVRVVGGGTPSTTNSGFWDGAVNWATPKDLASLTSPVLLDTDRRITDAGLRQISSGLLPVGTVLLSSRAPIGYLAISEAPVAINQGFIAMVCDKELPNYYVRLWANANMDAIEANANGTTFMEISKKNFRLLPILVPSKTILDEFMHKVEPVHRRVVSNLRESRTLAGLRDALLPKLLSGELRIKDSERIIGERA